MFADQVGGRTDHLAGHTQGGLKGHTPTTTRTGDRFDINAMSTISPTGRPYLNVCEGAFTAPVFLGFLERVVGHFTTKVHLVVDQHSVHRAKAVRAWVHDHAERIELHFLPSYSPRPNPDELVNADVKRYLADEVITNGQHAGPGSLVLPWCSAAHGSCPAQYAYSLPFHLGAEGPQKPGQPHSAIFIRSLNF